MIQHVSGAQASTVINKHILRVLCNVVGHLGVSLQPLVGERWLLTALTNQTGSCARRDHAGPSQSLQKEDFS